MNDVIISLRTAHRILETLNNVPEKLRAHDWHTSRESLRIAIKETENPVEALNERNIVYRGGSTADCPVC